MPVWVLQLGPTIIWVLPAEPTEEREGRVKLIQWAFLTTPLSSLCWLAVVAGWVLVLMAAKEVLEAVYYLYSRAA